METETQEGDSMMGTFSSWDEPGPTWVEPPWRKKERLARDAAKHAAQGFACSCHPGPDGDLPGTVAEESDVDK